MDGTTANINVIKYAGSQKRRKNKQTFIHASGWIRTHIPNFKRLEIHRIPYKTTNSLHTCGYWLCKKNFVP